VTPAISILPNDNGEDTKVDRPPGSAPGDGRGIAPISRITGQDAFGTLIPLETLRGWKDRTFCVADKHSLVKGEMHEFQCR
jgi:hypothetical protein